MSDARHVYAIRYVNVPFLRNLYVTGNCLFARTVSTLPYHHPADKQFSLVFVTGDGDQFEKRVSQERERNHADVLTHTDEIDGNARFSVFTDTHRPATTTPEFDSEEELRAWLRSEFGSDLPIVQGVYTFFDELKQEESNRGNTLQAYKEIELEKLPDILNKVEWSRKVPAVGADLLSKFILTHPMPNTNHRTGIVLLNSYLRSYDETVSIPETGRPGEWHQWAAEYVEDSKRLLTLRRRYRIFRYAAELGYDVVERKHGVEIRLNEYEIHRSDAFDHFTERHRGRTREFVDIILEKSGADGLTNTVDLGRQRFVEKL